MSFLGRRAPRLSLVFWGGTTDRNWLTKNNRYLTAANRYHLTCGVIQRPGREKSALLAKRGAQSAPEQEFSAYHLFFLLCSRAIIVLYCIVTHTRPLLASPHPPYAAAAARRRHCRCRILLLLRCRSMPPLSPRSHSPTSFAFAARHVVSAAAHLPIAPPSSIKVVAHQVNRYH